MITPCVIMDKSLPSSESMVVVCFDWDPGSEVGGVTWGKPP